LGSYSFEIIILLFFTEPDANGMWMNGIEKAVGNWQSFPTKRSSTADKRGLCCYVFVRSGDGKRFRIRCCGSEVLIDK